MRGYGLQKPPAGAQLSGGHPLAAGLVGCWPFLGGGGTPRNLVQPNAGASVTGATWAQGESGPALQFNATTDHYDTNDLSGQAYAAGTVVWRLAPGFGAGTARFFWGQESGSGATPEFSCQVTTTAWFVGWNNASGDRRVTTATSASNLVQGSWQSYAFVWSPANSQLYRNGVLIAQNAIAPTPTAVASTFWIGGTHTSGNTFPGLGSASLLDSVYVYRRALSGAEIQWLYVAPYAMFAPRGPLSLWAR